MNDEKPPSEKRESNALTRVLQDTLKGILTPEQQKQVTEQLKPKLETVLAVTVSKHHSGPLPSVETAEGYERVVPGSFERILAMAEKDQEAFIRSAEYQAAVDSRFRTTCLFSGLAALGAILGVTVYLAVTGHENVAIAVAALGSVGVIGAFINARYSSSAGAPPST